ncbi:hypothetical protein YC2023_123131 [Brassica napus]
MNIHEVVKTINQVFVPKLALNAKSHKNSTQGVGFRDRSSKEEDDSELKTVLECVSVAFTTWSGSREIVTLNCDVDIQSAPRKLVETNPAASSGPERTAPQDSKTVIDMDKHLHKIGGKALLKKEADDENDDPSEPTGKWKERLLFEQER